jgi:hypothetical protein
MLSMGHAGMAACASHVNESLAIKNRVARAESTSASSQKHLKFWVLSPAAQNKAARASISAGAAWRRAMRHRNQAYFFVTTRTMSRQRLE